MKKPESEIRSAAIHAKIRPRFKKMAEKMATTIAASPNGLRR
jgi:hypothetical protein